MGDGVIKMKILDSYDSVEERLEKYNSFKDHNKGDNIVACLTNQETGQKQWQFTHNLVTSDGDIYYAKQITLKKSDGSTYTQANFSTDKILFHHDGSSTVDSSTVHGCMVLGSATTTPHQGDTYGVSGSSGTTFSSASYDASHGSINTTKTLRSDYPRFNDGDADNTGGANDQVTWSYNWATGDFDTTGANDLKGGVIVDRNKLATPASTAKLLCHFNFSSAFEKTGNDTLKVFVNHTFEGA